MKEAHVDDGGGDRGKTRVAVTPHSASGMVGVTWGDMVGVTCGDIVEVTWGDKVGVTWVDTVGVTWVDSYPPCRRPWAGVTWA